MVLPVWLDGVLVWIDGAGSCGIGAQSTDLFPDQSWFDGPCREDETRDIHGFWRSRRLCLPGPSGMGGVQRLRLVPVCSGCAWSEHNPPHRVWPTSAAQTATGDRVTFHRVVIGSRLAR